MTEEKDVALTLLQAIASLADIDMEDRGRQLQMLIETIALTLKREKEEYAQIKKAEWCRKQREICAEKAFLVLSGDALTVDKELILNAPEP